MPELDISAKSKVPSRQRCGVLATAVDEADAHITRLFDTQWSKLVTRGDRDYEIMLFKVKLAWKWTFARLKFL